MVRTVPAALPPVAGVPVVPKIRCLHCLDDGHVCETHPDYPWDMTVEGHRADCGAGMPCPACCSPIPEDGTTSIGVAFTPDWQRAVSASQAGT